MDIKPGSFLLGAIGVYLLMRPRTINVVAQVAEIEPESEQTMQEIEHARRYRVHAPGFVTGYTYQPIGPSSRPSVSEEALEVRGGQLLVDP